MEEVTTVNEAELHGEHAHEPARDVEAKLEEEKTPQECQPPSVERTGSQIQSLNQLLSKQIKSKMAESTSPVNQDSDSDVHGNESPENKHSTQTEDAKQEENQTAPAPVRFLSRQRSRVNSAFQDLGTIRESIQDTNGSARGGDNKPLNAQDAERPEQVARDEPVHEVPESHETVPESELDWNRSLKSPRRHLRQGSPQENGANHLDEDEFEENHHDAAVMKSDGQPNSYSYDPVQWQNAWQESTALSYEETSSVPNHQEEDDWVYDDGSFGDSRRFSPEYVRDCFRRAYSDESSPREPYGDEASKRPHGLREYAAYESAGMYRSMQSLGSEGWERRASDSTNHLGYANNFIRPSPSPTMSGDDPNMMFNRTFSQASFRTGSLQPPTPTLVSMMDPGVRPFQHKQSDSAFEQLDSLLRALDLEFDDFERQTLLYAFFCPVCDTPNAACTTTSDQIRAVHDAFCLIDADGDKAITLTDLRDIASWASDDRRWQKTMKSAVLVSDIQTLTAVQVPLSCKDFMLAFARCLCISAEDGMEEVLEKRANEYRRIGKLFGMERIQNHFQWTKFWLSFFSASFAFIAFPLCKVLDKYRSMVEWKHGTARARRGSIGGLKRKEQATLYDILTDSQWLPPPKTTFDSFQIYLMTQWVPCIFSLVIYIMFQSHMQDVSVMEVLSPIGNYIIIGMYIATISGYEHPKLVLRRLNPAMSSELKHNELQAVFAFRAHTPEGHAVDQIGAITDILFASRFRWFSAVVSGFAGVFHAIIPILHRIFIRTVTNEATGVCIAEIELLWYEKLYVWVCGGREWVHFLVSVPSMAISGYLTYRLLYTTLSGFHNDLNFYYKLVLFRAATQAEPFLRYRARWIRAQSELRNRGRREFLQFLNLQKKDDLLLWCRIRHLLTESYAGFKSKQGDIIVSYLLVSVLVYASYIFLYFGGSQLSVFDLRARFDVFVFSILLLAIVNLKLSIHHLRKSDIHLLHKEYYYASMHDSECHESGAEYLNHRTDMPAEEGFEMTSSGEMSPGRGYPPQRFEASFARRRYVEEEMGDEPGSQAMQLPRSMSSGMQGLQVYRREPDPHMQSFSSYGREGELRKSLSPMPDSNNPISPYNIYGAAMPQPQPFNRMELDTDRPSGRGSAMSWQWDQRVGSPQHGGNNHARQLQSLLQHTAHYIQEFDRPPRLLSFTVSIHFLRYIFLPLLSPLFAVFRSYAFQSSSKHTRI